MRRFVLLFAASAALALASCNSHSMSLDLSPNPLVVGVLDTQATVHAHAVARGFGKIPIGALQFAVYNGADDELASQTQSVDASIPTTPLGVVVDKDFTFPINGALVALSGMKYIEVRVLGPGGDVIAARRLDVVVHALKGLPIPQVVQPTSTPAH
jgi:hypothetical protein